MLRGAPSSVSLFDASLIRRIFATATRGEAAPTTRAAASHPGAATDLMLSERRASGVSESITTGTPTRPVSARKRDRRTVEPVAHTLLPSDDKRAPTTRHPRLPREEPDHLLDVDEAAAMLGIAPATLRNWAYQRRIRKVKLGGLRGPLRFRASDLRRYIHASVQAPIGARLTPGEVA
jgi:excisionase family DNA binding protein